jgi:hypothetical protein
VLAAQVAPAVRAFEWPHTKSIAKQVWVLLVCAADELFSANFVIPMEVNMSCKSFLAASTLACAAALGLASSPAAAGTLDQAQVACFVDTYAYDQLTTDYCASVWTPGSADMDSVAYFEVVGLPAGNYTYSWNFGCANANYCVTGISARFDPTKTAYVTVRNVATGEQRALSATADYINGWD